MTGLAFWSVLAAIAPLLPLWIGLYNRCTWRRPTASPLASRAATGRVSVLVPARNEAHNIRECVESVLAQGAVVAEVLVYSDESTDETESIVRSLGERDGRVRLLVGDSLPPGWVGKPHACHRLGLEATANWLLFLDADVRLSPGALGGILEAASDPEPVDVVSLVPRQQGKTFWLEVLQPLLLLTYLSWLPLAWANRQKNPRFVAACGQVLLVARAAFEQTNGFTTVRHAVVDDVEFCRQARRLGLRVVFLDGHDVAVCRMYDSVRAFWSGFGKNVFAGLGSELNLVIGLGLHAGCFLLPYVVLAVCVLEVRDASSFDLAMLGLSGVGVLENVLQRAVQARRHRESPWSVLLHPLAVVVLSCLALDSWRRTRFGQVEWSGRRYRSVLV